MKKIIIAVVAVLVALGGTFAGLWFFTDVLNFLKPANEVFSSQIEKAFNLQDAKFADYSEFLEEYKEVSGKSTSMKLNLSANLNLSDLDDEIQDTINKSKLSFEINSDMNSKKYQGKIGLYTDNTEILTLDMVANDTTIGIGSKDLYDKYLSLSLEDAIELLDDYSDETGLTSSDIAALESAISSLSSTSIDTYELLYISEDDLKHFDKTYRNCLTTLISKDCYSSEKNVEIEVDDEDVKATAYYLTLTGKDAYDSLKNLADVVKEDEVIPRLIADKMNLIIGGMSEDAEKISESDVDELIDELMDSLVDELEYISEDDEMAIQIAVYSKSNKPVRIEFNTLDDVEDFDEKDTYFSVEFTDEKQIYSIYEDNEVMASLTNTISTNKDDEKAGKMKLEMSGMEFGTLDYELVTKEDESKVKLDLNIPLADVSANLDFSSTGDYRKEAVKFSGSFGLEYESESMEIKFDGSTEYGNASVPELTSSNSVDVLDLSEKEMEDLLLDILENAADVLPERLELLGIDIDSEDILPSNIRQDTQAAPITSTETTTDDVDDEEKSTDDAA